MQFAPLQCASLLGFIAAGLAFTHESNSSMACHETRPSSMPVLGKQPLITAASASFEAPCQTRGPHSAQRTRRARRKADPFALRACSCLKRFTTAFTPEPLKGSSQGASAPPTCEDAANTSKARSPACPAPRRGLRARVAEARSSQANSPPAPMAMHALLCAPPRCARDDGAEAAAAIKWVDCTRARAQRLHQ